MRFVKAQAVCTCNDGRRPLFENIRLDTACMASFRKQQMCMILSFRVINCRPPSCPLFETIFYIKIKSSCTKKKKPAGTNKMTVCYAW